MYLKICHIIFHDLLYNIGIQMKLPTLEDCIMIPSAQDYITIPSILDCIVPFYRGFLCDFLYYLKAI